MKKSILPILSVLFLSTMISNVEAKTFKVTFPNKNYITGNPNSFKYCSGKTLFLSVTLSYNGTMGYDGSRQTVAIPSGTTCVEIVAKGGGGGSAYNNNGGNGDLIKGQLNITNQTGFVVMVAGGGGMAAGGGFTEVFASDGNEGYLIAGGGGGAGQYAVGYNAAFNPKQPTVANTNTGGSGGFGFGGSGAPSSTAVAVATPFGNGGYRSDNFGSGGYGGGGYFGESGTGGGGGLHGGNSGSASGCNGGYCPGGGGQSLCTSNLAKCDEFEGQGGQGGATGNPTGKNGQVQFYFFK